MDINITGKWGFYHIQAFTDEGRTFLDEEVDGVTNGSAFSDGTGMTQDIADGAVEQGLTVEVNGVAYAGDDKNGR